MLLSLYLGITWKGLLGQIVVVIGGGVVLTHAFLASLQGDAPAVSLGTILREPLA